MKKFLTLLLCGAMLFSAVGCTHGGKEDEVKFVGQPDYEQFVDSRQMMISAYWAPKHTQEQFQGVKDCGITHLYLESKYGKPGTQEYIKALELPEKLGIKIIAQRVSKDLPFTEDETDYSKYTCFAGHNIWDEPTKANFDTIELELEVFQDRYPNGEAEFYSNLFPLYAKPEQLGFDSFEEYVEQYCKQVVSKIKHHRSLSCDSYPLIHNESRDVNHLLAGHLVSLNTIARAAKKYDADAYFFIQDMDFGKGRRAPLQADFCLQVNAAFAFGIRGIQHFTYQTPQDEPGGEFLEGQTALVDRDGTRTERWEYARQINREIAAFDHVYLSFAWNGVMPVRGEEQNDAGDDFAMLKGALKEHSRIQSAVCGQDTLIGTFTDENGYDGFMVTPYRETTDNVTTQVELQFNQADSAIVWQKGERKIESLQNGKLKLSIQAGDGAFVIPYIEAK